MDNINWKILEILQQNARISFADLAKAVHLSAPAVAERVKRLEEQGVIEGFTTRINLDKIGLVIRAVVQVKVFTGKEGEFVRLANGSKHVLSCTNVTGEKAYMLRVAVSRMSQLDELLEDFSKVAETNTMVELSQPKPEQPVSQTLALD